MLRAKKGIHKNSESKYIFLLMDTFSVPLRTTFAIKKKISKCIHTYIYFFMRV